MKFWAATALLLLAAWSPLRGEPTLSLTSKGVACRLDGRGTFVLGIPSLDGRNTHAAALPASIETDGRKLMAEYGAPFLGVTVCMQVLDERRVEYVYDNLPTDVRVIMCQFNIPQASIVPGLAVTFDQHPPVAIPVAAGKTDKEVRLADLTAQKLAIQWPSGDTLSLTTPKPCWHGIQDARVWGKPYVGVCLTPSLARAHGVSSATFVMTFDVTPAAAVKNQPADGTDSPSPANDTRSTRETSIVR